MNPTKKNIQLWEEYLAWIPENYQDYLDFKREQEKREFEEYLKRKNEFYNFWGFKWLKFWKEPSEDGKWSYPPKPMQEPTIEGFFTWLATVKKGGDSN